MEEAWEGGDKARFWKRSLEWLRESRGILRLAGKLDLELGGRLGET